MTMWLPSVLVNHLWQSTLFVLAVWLATMALRSNDARARYWLWMAASIKFVFPLEALVSLGELLRWRTVPIDVEPAVSFVMQDVLAPVDVSAAAAVAPVSIAPTSSMWPPLLLGIWGVGMLLVLWSWWRQWAPIRLALRNATPVLLDGQYEAADLSVFSSPTLPEPGVVGIRRARLLLPEVILERLTPPQLRALIAHERCHIRCHDNLAAALHMVVEAVFWFHPVVWWIESKLVDERERACDEAVLGAGSRPEDYAEGLLEVCRQSVGVRLACVAGVSGSNLSARVESIMRNQTAHPVSFLRRCALAATAIVVVGGPVAGGALSSQSQIVVPPSVTFETASVRKVPPLGRFGPREAGMHAMLLRTSMSRTQGEQIKASGSLEMLIRAAYNVTDLQLDGGPSWIREDWYEIEGRPAGNTNDEQRQLMLQSLLAQRFNLVLRRETRRLPVYELVPSNDGFKISAMREGDCTPAKQIRWDLIDLNAPLFACEGFTRRRVLSQSPETRPFPRWPRVHRIEAGNISMATLIALISIDLDRVVLDKTGFTAPFNLLLDFAPAADPAASGPTLFEALDDQVGLQLLPADGSVDVLVIEGAERSVQN
jgi:uncharacterized protein (TIGR03435 family)